MQPSLSSLAPLILLVHARMLYVMFNSNRERESATKNVEEEGMNYAEL